MGGQDVVFVPAKHIAFRNIGGQMVLVHALDETLLTLNETGTAIWERLDGRGLQAIAREIHQQFQVSFEEAIADTEAFLTELEQKGFLQREPG